VKSDTGGRATRTEITEPGESEDFGVDWADPRALDRSARTSASTPITVHATQTRIFCAAFESRRNLTSFLIGTVARRRLPEEQP
jgi:hypothetical protein